jgi:hypothetical protein
MLDVRNARETVGGGVGSTGLLPPGRIPRGGPSPGPAKSPGPSRPGPDPLVGCGEGSPPPIWMMRGMRVGCINLAGRVLDRGAGAPPPRGAGAVSTATRPKLMGVETVRAAGSPMVFHSGNNSKQPTINACRPNDVNVVQLRRARWAQDVSSMLSANIVSSSVKSVCWYGHQERPPGRYSHQEKRPRFHAACWNFSDTRGVKLVIWVARSAWAPRASWCRPAWEQLA